MKIETEPIRSLYHLAVGVVSEKGDQHAINEDSYRIDPERGLFILADGMGGHQAGEVASQLAVEVLYNALSALPAGSLQEVLGTALLAAHWAIQEKAKEEAYRGMGTTALIGWVRVPDLFLWTAHVGNSRAYLWRNGTLQQLTEDHTLLNELRRAHLLPPDPRDWPSPAVLSQALGSRQPFLAPEFGEWPLQIGDRLLFCSDGISDVLPADVICDILSRSATPQIACELLVKAARRRGAYDDLTAIAVYIEAWNEQERPATFHALEAQR